MQATYLFERHTALGFVAPFSDLADSRPGLVLSSRLL
jgi:hypothetical protein